MQMKSEQRGQVLFAFAVVLGFAWVGAQQLGLENELVNALGILALFSGVTGVSSGQVATVESKVASKVESVKSTVDERVASVKTTNENALAATVQMFTRELQATQAKTQSSTDVMFNKLLTVSTDLADVRARVDTWKQIADEERDARVRSVESAARRDAEREAEMKSLRDRLAAQDKRMDDIQQQLTQAVTAREAAEKRVREIEDEKAQLASSIDKKIDELRDELRAEYQARIVTLEGERDALRGEIDGLNETIADLSAMLSEEDEDDATSDAVIDDGDGAGVVGDADGGGGGNGGFRRARWRRRRRGCSGL